ncbi:carbohydrate kinase family protein [Candidatus Bathyarchaeota archaeon]|nr:carbohydrate kinase family protein [Candidatus Bathyarchaeota archaeon]
MKSLVIGDLNVDIIVSGAPQLPVLGHEIPCEDIQTVMGGAASIFACRLAQLGGNVDIFGKLGNDVNGSIVLKNFRSSGVGVDKVKVLVGFKTGITISLTYPKNRALITYVAGIDNLTKFDVDPEIFLGYNHLHVSSIYILRKMLSSFSWLFSEAKKLGLTTSLDTNDDPLNKYEYIDEILRHVDIFLPNDKEAKAITGKNSVRAALEKLNEKVPVVVIKQGRKGAIGNDGKRTFKVKPLHIKPVDTTGAGDSFDAGFIYYYLHKNQDFKASLEFANALGALSCLYVGGAEERITEFDVIKFMAQQKGMEKTR